MAIFWTGDWHLYHKNMLDYCKEPFKNIKEKHKVLMTNYNQTVRNEDTCYFIGDIAMVGPSMWEHIKGIITKLNGRKHLVFGNHDEFKWQRYLDVGFTSVHSAHWMTLDGFNLVMAHDPAVYCALNPDTILICAHVHTLFRSLPKQKVINVGINMWDYKPVNFDQIRKELGI